MVIGRKLTQEEFLLRAKSVHGDKYDYSLSVYSTCATKVKVICTEHGIFEQIPSDHFGGHGCAKCAIDNTKLPFDEFVIRAKELHGNKYDYSLAEYNGTFNKIKIICPIHNIFEQSPHSHLRYGCQQCGFNDITLSLETIIDRIKNVHGNKYDYSLVEYKGIKEKIKIICKTHGSFEQKVWDHILGEGCKKCHFDLRRKTTEEFIEEAIKIHGDRYDYSLVDYKSSMKNVNIICKIHGIFQQIPSSHLRGSNCNICGVSISKGEIEWLDAMNIPKEYRQKYIKVGARRFSTDAFDPINNIVYEYNGDYWHGNPAIFAQDKIHPIKKITYGDAYNATLEKENIIKSAGYTVISIWENDWKILKNITL